MTGGRRNNAERVDRSGKRVYNHKQKMKIVCPRCGRPTGVMVMPGQTVLRCFPLWCKYCKCESIVSFDGESQRSWSPEPTA
ncbi:MULTISPECIES: cysteine-rich KTR domain-containing protein [Agathobaculum]|uniref:cysteine-rich KTR domain-containing protein n=1 Tax=Agathobaculum TaxID=2048137 RepID=UPI0038B3D796